MLCNAMQYHVCIVMQCMYTCMYMCVCTYVTYISYIYIHIHIHVCIYSKHALTSTHLHAYMDWPELVFHWTPAASRKLLVWSRPWRTSSRSWRTIQRLMTGRLGCGVVILGYLWCLVYREQDGSLGFVLWSWAIQWVFWGDFEFLSDPHWHRNVLRMENCASNRSPLPQDTVF